MPPPPLPYCNLQAWNNEAESKLLQGWRMFHVFVVLFYGLNGVTAITEGILPHV